MNSLFNIGNLILLLILLIIFLVHYDYYCPDHDRFSKILIIASFLIFIIIFVKHIIYVRKNEDKHAKDYLKYINYKINPNNMAIRLWIHLLMHPIFHMV